MNHYSIQILSFTSIDNIMHCHGCTSNLSESLQIFSNRETAYAYFSKHQVFPSTVQCSYCEAPATFSIPMSVWRCQRIKHVDGVKIRCTFTRALKKNTWMASANLHLDVLGKLITYFLLLPPPHQDFIQSELKLSERTVVRWSEIIREAEYQWCLENLPQIIGGPNTVVEIDEAAFGHRKYNTGRKTATKWIFGGIQRGTRNMFFELVPDRKQQTLMEVIHRRILPGTTIMSDGWPAHNTISREGELLRPSYSPQFNHKFIEKK